MFVCILLNLAQKNCNSSTHNYFAALRGVVLFYAKEIFYNAITKSLLSLGSLSQEREIDDRLTTGSSFSAAFHSPSCGFVSRVCFQVHETPLRWFRAGVSKLFHLRATRAITQHSEGRTSYVMWLFRDILHSTITTSFC